jgi:hypothetical protein
VQGSRLRRALGDRRALERPPRSELIYAARHRPEPWIDPGWRHDVATPQRHPEPLSDILLASPAAAREAASHSAAAETVWRWRERAQVGDDRAAAAAARKKGLVGGVVGLLAAGALALFSRPDALFWRPVALWRPEAAWIVAGIAVVTTLLALVSPLGGFRRLTRALEAFGHGVGVTLTWVLMAVAYALLFLPVGLVLRAAGKLRITRGADARLASYWQQPPPTTPGLDGYRKPF